MNSSPARGRWRREAVTEGEEGVKLGSSKRNRDQARVLRRKMTLPEIILWRELRRLSVRIRKQVPADPYVLDFYCAKARLVIEVDGEAHDRGTDRSVTRAEMSG
jgi:very-short-patch-repair endonuclease